VAPGSEQGHHEDSSPAGSAGAAPGADRSQPLVSPGRRIGVRVLIWVTTVLAVLGIFAGWANRQMLDPDNWGKTSTKLLQNAAVREATANYLVDQLYANVNVAGELNARLPSQLKPLSGPIAGGLRSLATEGAKRALAAGRVQELWRAANRAADQTFVTIVEGGKGPVGVQRGEVTLDLASIVADITTRLGLPNVSSKLPPSAGKLKVLKSDQIQVVQEAGNALKGLALALSIIVPLLYALAVALARGFRRRALMLVGIGLVSAGIVVFLIRSVVVTQVTDSLVKTESVKPAAHAVLSIATSMLAEIAGAVIVVGVPLIVAAWLAGPARLAVAARRAIAPFMRERPEWTYGIVAAVMLLIFIWQPIPATGKLGWIVVFLVLAFLGTYVLRRQTAAEFPGETSRAAPAPG
jgi:hypothetical protein